MATDFRTGIPDEARVNPALPFYGSESAAQVETLPWAARYLECASEAKDLCKQRRYNATCWIPRDDVEPVTKQRPQPQGQASWHPGNRASWWSMKRAG